MLETYLQKSFFDSSVRAQRAKKIPDLPPTLAIGCEGVYQKAWHLWEAFNIKLPDDLKTDPKAQIPVLNRANVSVASRGSSCFPYIKYFDIPPQYESLLMEYSLKNGYGDSSFLPSFPSLARRLGKSWFEACDEEVDPKLTSELENIEAAYQEWYEQAMVEWAESAPPRFLGWKVVITYCTKDSFPKTAFDYHPILTFRLSSKRRLTKLIISSPWQNKENPHYFHPFARLAFIGNRAISIWHEEENGSFFPDPKGEKDQIWPGWVTGIDESFYDKDRSYQLYPPCEDDWIAYLARVRNKKPVVSGRNFKFTKQTERQANENLQASRNSFYYQNHQAFHFRRARQEAGFRSELGYVARGRYGHYISHSPQSYQNLTLEETSRYLLRWNPWALIPEGLANRQDLESSAWQAIPIQSMSTSSIF